MNNPIQVRKMAPPTPNLDDYKQKNKSRSRRKPAAIQPTNPPTPKLTKANLHIKQTHKEQLEVK